MPYHGASDPDLPRHIKTKSHAYRKQWVAAWNATYDDCKKGGGSTEKCESKAFAVATAQADKYHGPLSKFDDIKTTPR